MYYFELDSTSHSCLLLFFGQSEGTEIEYGRSVEKAIKRNRKVYEEIILLFPKFLESEVLELAKSESKLVSNLERAADTVQFTYSRFDVDGSLKVVLAQGCYEASVTNNLERLADSIVKSGIFRLVSNRKDSVIQTAPPGTVFQKPSKKIFREFIKASELAVGYSEIQFLAYCLLREMPKRQIQTIWIDTSGISSLVQALISYIEKFEGGNSQAIKFLSFQSYGDSDKSGYKVRTPDVTEDVWVIISASRSNSLGRDIIRSWKGLQHEQVTTILSFTDTKYSEDEPQGVCEPGDNIVCNISNFSDEHRLSLRTGSEIPIKISGENFNAQIEDPNKVVLKRSHKPRTVSQTIEPLNSLKCIISNRNKDDRTRDCYFDFYSFRRTDNGLSKKYDLWLDDCLNWYLPKNLGAIIYDDDEPGNALLKDVESKLNGSKINKVSSQNIDILRSAPNQSVLILKPVLSHGHSLVKLNSELRLIGHDAQRIFVNPFATPQSKAAHEDFKSSLVLGPRGLKYHFNNFRRIYTGHSGEENSWQRELRVVENFKHQFWNEREEQLRKTSRGLVNEIGVNFNSGVTPLRFSIDFAFWEKKYCPDEINLSTVYWTISSILQNLREKPFTRSDTDSLFSHVYQQTVLDPSNFARFNDPLLQSCLWRSANDGELDYRGNQSLSINFVDILLRLLRSQISGDDTAALDILVGVAIGKIRLAKRETQRLVKSACNMAINCEACCELLDYIRSTLVDECIDGPPF